MISSLLEHVRDPRWWSGRVRDRINQPFQRYVYPGYDGLAVMEEDWDNLIVLDACRYDLFEETVDVTKFDSYSRVKSLGSATPEWTRRNFSGKQFADTVYVTGNPFTTKFAKDSFYRLYEVWGDLDEETGTILPATVIAEARRAAEAHPDKRLVVHLMQPHHPFVGATEWDDRLTPEETYSGVADPETPWTWLRDGKVTRAEVWKHYKDNLMFVLDDAIEIAEELPGRSVLTSDHGNLLGERDFPIPLRRYGHPPGTRIHEAITVPWAVLDDSRREITTGEIEGRKVSESDEALIEERLADLGYHE